MPKSDTISDRKGLSSAVKNEEKHISIHPTIYEKANIFIAVILTLKRSVSYGLTKTFATVGPAKNINRKATMDVVTEAITTRLNMAFILHLSPAP